MRNSADFYQREGKPTLSPVLVALVLIFLIACGSIGLPDRTSRKIAIADVAGTYSLTTDHESAATVQLNTDGTFEITNADEQSGTGTWQLDGAEITLKYGAGKFDHGWYVIDTPDGGLTILGGSGDPDSWHPMKKVGPPAR
jgi:hypothetical protein